MPIVDATIVNKLGLHARAASKLSDVANRFEAEVFIEYNGRTIDAKSIMAVMMLAAAKGSNVRIKTKGVDEIEALNALVELIENRFDEEE